MDSLLNENLIVLNADVQTAGDCIRLMGKLFEEHGYVLDGYAEAVAAREAEYPTGLPGKGINIAIPHTNNQLVIKPAVGVIVPRRPVTFHMMGNKDQTLSCELLMPLVVKDSKQQLGMLKKMMKIIQDSQLLMSIKNAATKAEIVALLSVLNVS